MVYVSTACWPLTVAELESLLMSARAANRENSVSGILLYDDGNFMQCFEGPDGAVHSTYARIRASRQHKDIVELLNERVSARSFGGWDMGLARPVRSEMLALSTARWTLEAKATVEHESVSLGLGLLRLFWNNARRAR